MKGTEAFIRVHRYGTLFIWDIAHTRTKGKNLRTNVFTVTSRKGRRSFFSKGEAKGHMRALIKDVPDEFRKEFNLHTEVLESIL